MSEIRENALKEFTRVLRERHPEKISKIIIVFGSYVRGDFTKESDVDVRIVGDITLEDAIDISYPIMLKHGVYISPKVKAPKDFDAQKNYSFLKSVVSEGIAVWARLKNCKSINFSKPIR